MQFSSSCSDLKAIAHAITALSGTTLAGTTLAGITLAGIITLACAILAGAILACRGTEPVDGTGCRL